MAERGRGVIRVTTELLLETLNLYPSVSIYGARVTDRGIVDLLVEADWLPPGDSEQLVDVTFRQRLLYSLYEVTSSMGSEGERFHRQAVVAKSPDALPV